MSSSPLLSVKNLAKHFDGGFVVDHISFDVEKGSIVGLLGQNGAGKTTTIHMLCGITTPTNGEIHYFGKPFATNKAHCLQRINFTSSYNSLQEHISVRENLMVFALLYNVKNHTKKISDLADYFEIGDYLHKTLINLSSGQKTRVNLVKALLNDPELILMDEPTASLDPDIADKTLSFIESLRQKRGVSILYTSHNMEEITRICDRVIFLKKGIIVAQDSPQKLIKRVGLDTLSDVFLHIARSHKT